MREAAGFVDEERVEGSVEWCEGREEVSFGAGTALEPVYAR